MPSIRDLTMNRKTYSFHEVCKNIMDFEGVLPPVNYSSYMNARFYFLYTDFYEFPLDSEEGFSQVRDRMYRYIKFTNQMSGSYTVSLAIVYIEKIRRNYQFKKWYSFIFRKKLLISKNNPSIDINHNLKD